MLAIQEICDEAMTMQPLEKIRLIDKLLLSLDIPNQTIEEEWNKEAQERIEAYNEGKIKSIPMDKVFAKYIS